jgi:ribose transport system substrate-binding protein
MTLIRKRWLASAAVAVLASAALAGCGSSSGGGGSSSSSSGSSGDLAKAQQEVTSLEAVTKTYPVPTASVSGVSAFKGRKVYYIPLVQSIPGFVVTASSMKQALGTAGLSQQVCDGQGQPSAVAACVQQAVAANAAGIVLDAIPYGMAQNALDAAKAKGIPIIIADQYAPTSGTANTDQVTYVPGATDQPTAIAWWIINASKGAAKAIIAEEVDSPSSKQYVTNSLSIYKQYCPGCTIKVKDITASTDALLATDTSSNILTDPGVQYYYTEFEDSLQPTIQGIQQSGHTSSVALSVAGGSVNGLGLLKSGSSTVKAVVAVDEAYAGYALTDEILRMMTKSSPVAEPYPTRLFTSDNIGSIDVTTTAQSSGTWFGDTSFETSYAALWRVG